METVIEALRLLKRQVALEATLGMTIPVRTTAKTQFEVVFGDRFEVNQISLSPVGSLIETFR